MPDPAPSPAPQPASSLKSSLSPAPSPRRPRFSAKAAPIEKPLPLRILFPVFFTLIFLSHWTLLRLPYFWDEAGYYIPAALDFLRTGSLIPHSTLTNAHPPLPSILLTGWWRISGFNVFSTRTFVCMISATALLGLFRLARELAGNAVAAVVTFLTAIYPIWFVQSILAHADIFAAAFTLWALSYYLQHLADPPGTRSHYVATAILFSCAALAKETSIVTPVVLALWELSILLTAATEKKPPSGHRTDPLWIAALLFPLLPLILWYTYHFHQTGFVFGNPEFLRYNATANLAPIRILVSLWHRFVHLFLHMNLYVPVFCTVAVLLMPRLPNRAPSPLLSKPVLTTLFVLVLGNALAFSILGGALLTRYLLPLYPLILLVCVCLWRQRMRHWFWLAALTTAGFLAALFINPPYAFAPEDNLTYRDMILLHQQAIHLIATHYPQATVLTAWPATTELEHPDLGYTWIPIKTTALDNFSFGEIQKAAAGPGDFDTALLFSTKWVPPPGHLDVGHFHEQADAKLFDFHRDLPPADVARILHGDIVWQSSRHGEWAAVLRFPRSVEANLIPPTR